jgi:hypothetical protein
MDTDEIKIRIERLFGQKIPFYQKLKAGYVNSLFLIKTNNDAYIAKAYNEHLPIRQILFSVDVQIKGSRVNAVALSQTIAKKNTKQRWPVAKIKS